MCPNRNFNDLSFRGDIYHSLEHLLLHTGIEKFAFGFTGLTNLGERFPKLLELAKMESTKDEIG